MECQLHKLSGKQPLHGESTLVMSSFQGEPTNIFLIDKGLDQKPFYKNCIYLGLNILSRYIPAIDVLYIFIYTHYITPISIYPITFDYIHL